MSVKTIWSHVDCSSMWQRKPITVPLYNSRLTCTYIAERLPSRAFIFVFYFKMWFSCYWKPGDTFSLTPVTAGAFFTRCNLRWIPRLRSRRLLPLVASNFENTNWASLNCECVHVWKKNKMYHPANPGRCKSDSFHKRGTSDWMVPLSKGSLILAGKTPRAPRLFSLAGVHPDAQRWHFWRSSLFLVDFCMERHTSYQPVGRLRPPSCSSILTVPFFSLFFWFVFFVFSSTRVASCHLKKKKKRPPCVFVFSFCFSKMYNNECTSTDWKRTLWTHCGLTH